MGKYQGYDKYKDSGVEWLGAIPEHWEVKRFKFLLQDGYEGLKIGPFGSQIKSEKLSLYGNYKVYGQENIINQDFSLGHRYLEDELFHELSIYEIRAKDLLITMMGTSGRCYIVPEYFQKGIMDSHLIRLRLTNNYNLDFIRYLIDESEYVSYQVKVLGKGSIMHGLNSTIIKNLELIIPPLEEQEKIARFLDYKTKQIDDLIAKKETLIEKLDEKRTALITHAVTKGLDVNVPMKDSGIEWLGAIPQHWEISKAKFVSRIFVPQRNKPDLNLDDGFSWLTMDDMLSDTVTNTTFKVTKEAAQNAGSRVLKKGSVVASCVGNFGVCAVINVDVIINQQLQAFIPDKNIIPEFLREIVKISKDYFQMIATAATVVYVNQSGFANMPIILPPKEEQEKIINYIAITKEKLEEQKTKIQQAIDLLKEYRTALITNAVTGKIDVRKITIPKI